MQIMFIHMDTIKIKMDAIFHEQFLSDVWKLRVGRKGDTETQSETNVMFVQNIIRPK